MKYRKIGLRMCIISIIMITLCIPNQMQIAKAAENEPEIKVIDEHGVSWDTDTTLEVFSKGKNEETATINPGGSGEYKFQISNQSDFNMTYDLIIWEENNQNYSIEYKILNNEGKQLVNEDWVRLNSALKYSTKLNSYSRDDLKLKWRFVDTGEDIKEDSYKIYLKVIAKQITNSDDNPVTPPNPDTPVNPDNPNKPDNGNNSNNNNSNNDSNNKGNNTNNGSDDSKGNGSSNNKQENNQNNNQDNLNIDKTSSKGTGSTTNKKKVNTSDITTPVIYVALMILTFGLILLVKSRKES